MISRNYFFTRCRGKSGETNFSWYSKLDCQDRAVDGDTVNQIAYYGCIELLRENLPPVPTIIYTSLQMIPGHLEKDNEPSNAVLRLLHRRLGQILKNQKYTRIEFMYKDEIEESIAKLKLPRQRAK